MKRVTLVLIGFTTIMIGCSPEHSTSEKEEESALVTEDSKQVTSITDNQRDFTYLEEFSEDQLESYNDFLQKGNIDSLKDFTPEEILLLYMNLVYERNLDKLYELTYNGGEFPSIDVFIEEYWEKHSWDLEQSYLLFRYYDDVAINTASNDEVTIVHFEIRFGNRTHYQTFPLVLEDGIWKVSAFLKKEEHSQ